MAWITAMAANIWARFSAGLAQHSEDQEWAGFISYIALAQVTTDSCM